MCLFVPEFPVQNDLREECTTGQGEGQFIQTQTTLPVSSRRLFCVFSFLLFLENSADYFIDPAVKIDSLHVPLARQIQPRQSNQAKYTQRLYVTTGSQLATMLHQRVKCKRDENFQTSRLPISQGRKTNMGGFEQY